MLHCSKILHYSELLHYSEMLRYSELLRYCESSNYSLFSKDRSLVFFYVRLRLRHRCILLFNNCLRLPRNVRSTQVREAGLMCVVFLQQLRLLVSSQWLADSSCASRSL